ncbi:MAG: hypothetical protein JHC55_11850, partial [Mycolicibacterium sp.]|nr:hypothetical protein [Mycolicibacterium sp.]
MASQLTSVPPHQQAYAPALAAASTPTPLLAAILLGGQSAPGDDVVAAYPAASGVSSPAASAKSPVGNTASAGHTAITAAPATGTIATAAHIGDDRADLGGSPVAARSAAAVSAVAPSLPGTPPPALGTVIQS